MLFRLQPLSLCGFPVLVDRLQLPVIAIENEGRGASGGELIAGIVGHVDQRLRQIGQIDALSEDDRLGLAAYILNVLDVARLTVLSTPWW